MTALSDERPSALSLEAALAQSARHVETFLDGYLTTPRQDAIARLISAMRHGSLNGGKRLRPFLVMETAQLFGVAAERSVRAAAALECIHCYSLVHDDLPAMDDDDLRRGKPTVHVAFDEATAILAGDGLLTAAFHIMADPATHGDAAVRCELVAELAFASGMDGMVGGQALDLAGEEKTLTEDEIVDLQRLKTGALIRFGPMAGAIIGGASDAEKAALVRYAEGLGLAFQIADDLLDVEGDTATLGKTAGKDVEQGKATFVSLRGIEGARAKLNEVADAASAELDIFGARADLLRDTVRFVVERKA